MFEEHIWADEIHHECCPVCSNEEIFDELMDGDLICGICGELLKVQSSEQKVKTDEGKIMACSGATSCDTDLTNEDVDKIKEQWRKYYASKEYKNRFKNGE
jgi:transcription initiation factor TFIIIB Brf1 subunit/transcription initiation factor TFIIB